MFHNPHVLYIFPYSVSLHSQSVQFLLTFYYFQSSLQIFVHTSLRHCNCFLCLILLFFVHHFTFFISYFVLCFFCLFFLLLCSPEFLHSIIMFPCIVFVSQMSLPAEFQLFFLAFPLFCPTHQVTQLASQNPGHLLSKHFLTACFLQFPPSYLWLYFLV